MTPSTWQIPQLIPALRKRRNLFHEQVAAPLGLSWQRINRWEKE